MRRSICLTLGLTLLLVGGAAAWSLPFFGKKKAAEAPAAAPAQEQQQAAKAAEPAPTQRLFWYNDVTKESQWEAPSYEAVDGERRPAPTAGVVEHQGRRLSARRAY